MTEWLAGYNDPIKLLLGTHIQKTNRVVIKRKHVVGQSAIITPEHAPAQSVAVQEEVTEVVPSCLRARWRKRADPRPRRSGWRGSAETLSSTSTFSSSPTKQRCRALLVVFF